jgi:hypothetical protein
VVSVAIARRVGDKIEFLGEWDLVGGRNCWTPDH